MRFLLLFFLASCFQPVFAQTPVIKKTYWKNGTIKCEQGFVNDTAEGICKEYDEDGKLVRQALYHHGKLNGEERKFTPSGILIQVTFYKDDITDSVKLGWYDDGRMKSEENFSLGIRNGVSRSFFHDGHEQHYANYRNGILEGRYIDVNDQRLTELEGYYWHGRWVWMRRFCDNKFCEMGGMDTLTGKDSMMYYDEHANMVRKTVRFMRDSSEHQYIWIWDASGTLTSKVEHYTLDSIEYNFVATWQSNGRPVFKREAAPATDGYYYDKEYRWENGTDSISVSYMIRIDSCTIAEYAQKNRTGKSVTHARQLEYYPGLHLKKASAFEGDTERYCAFYEDGRVMSTGMNIRGECAGLRIDNLDSGFVKHAWCGLPGGYCDTVFYPGGKIFEIVKASYHINKGMTIRQWYLNGNLKREFEGKDLLDNYTETTWYENGRVESKSYKYTRKNRRTERHVYYYSSGIISRIVSDKDGRFRNRQMEASYFETGLPAFYNSFHSKLISFGPDPRYKGKQQTWFESGQERLRVHLVYAEKSSGSTMIIRGHRKLCDKQGKETENRSLNKKDDLQQVLDDGSFRLKF